MDASEMVMDLVVESVGPDGRAPRPSPIFSIFI